MKKFSIKAMLAVVLILVLVLSLVACNDTDKCKDGHTNANQDRNCDVCGEEIAKCATCTDADNNKKCDVCGSKVSPQECTDHTDDNSDGLCDNCGEEIGNVTTTSEAFFQNLWNAAAPIGGTKPAEEDDLAVEMDMSLALGNNGTLADLGINIGLVLDRENGAHSAAKIGVYDHENNANLFTVYYFLDDPYFFYINALGQSFKMAVDYNYNEEAAAIINDTINANLGELLGADTLKDFPNVAAESVMSIINNLVDDFGAAWNLDQPINAITGLLGVNIGELLGSEDMAGTLTMVNGILVQLANSLGVKGFKGIEPEKLAQSDSVILDLLVGVGPLLFRTVEDIDGGQITYLDLTKNGIIGKASGLLRGLPMGLGTLITEMEEISLSYTKDDAGVIDSFGMNIVLGTDDKPFSIGLSINELAITGVDAANADDILGADKETFKDYFEINTGLTIEIAPETLVVSLPGEEAFDFEGTYTMALRGQIDFMNDPASTEKENETRVYANIKHNTTEIARLTFDGSSLALGVDSSSPVVKFIVEEGISLLLQSLAEAKQVDGQDDIWLQGLVMGIANVAYTANYADAAALKAATDFEINTALTLDNGVAITGITLSDIKTHGLRLLDAATTAIGGFLGGSESAAVEDDLAGIVEQAWQPNIYKLLTLLSKAIDGNLKTGLTAEIDDLGDFICKLFNEVTPTEDDPRTQTGPLTTEELCYGNLEAGIFGLFTMLDSESWNAKQFATDTFGEAAWAGEDILVELMSSSISINIKSDMTGSIRIANGDCYIAISYSAGITASDNAPSWDNVTFPDVSTWATYVL